MSSVVIILLFFCSLVLIFGAGFLIGKLLKLDKYIEEIYNQPHKIE
jgi:hypothetical protein